MSTVLSGQGNAFRQMFFGEISSTAFSSACTARPGALGKHEGLVGCVWPRAHRAGCCHRLHGAPLSECVTL